MMCNAASKSICICLHVIPAWENMVSALGFWSRYILRYITSFIPDEVMSFAHSLHGKWRQYIVAHSRFCWWFWIMALASACVARQCPEPFSCHSTPALSLLQNHCSRQLGTPRGSPLYPDAIILLFFTITAPDLNFMQLARVAAMIAESMKYSSRLGRCVWCWAIPIIYRVKLYDNLYFVL